jgi:DNA-binding XRE family transcriptional regulator
MTTEEREIAELQNNLEMLRKLFGWTAEQLGNRLGVTKQTILNLEHGKPVMSKIQYIAIRSVMETEAMSREGEEKENLLKVLSLVFNEDKSITEEQREKALDAAKVVSTATAAGAGVTAMGVLTGSLTALGIGAVAVNPAIVAVAGAVGVGGWVAGMLNKTKQAEKQKQNKKGVKKDD